MDKNNPLREGKIKSGNKEPSNTPRPTNHPPSEGRPQKKSIYDSNKEKIKNLALDAAGEIGKLEFYGKRKTRDIVTATDIISNAIQETLKEIENWPRCGCGAPVLFDFQEPFASCSNGHGMEWGSQYAGDDWRKIQKLIMGRIVKDKVPGLRCASVHLKEAAASHFMEKDNVIAKTLMDYSNQFEAMAKSEEIIQTEERGEGNIDDYGVGGVEIIRGENDDG